MLLMSKIITVVLSHFENDKKYDSVHFDCRCATFVINARMQFAYRFAMFLIKGLNWNTSFLSTYTGVLKVKAHY